MVNLIYSQKTVFKVICNKLIIILLALTFAISGCSQNSLHNTDTIEQFSAYLDVRIPKLMKLYDIPGVTIAVVKEGQPTWAQAYGYADLEQGRKMTVDTVCRTQSISKSVTAWGVLHLVEQGKLELDVPITSYLKTWQIPASEFAAENITLRQLLSHTSGMPLGSIGVHYDPNGEVPTLEDNLTAQAQLINEPGSVYLYSNVGFNLLELLIEEVTGQDFAEYMKTTVLQPLGMQTAQYNWSETIQDVIPIGYDLNGEPVPGYVYPEKASGGLLASVTDIANFALAGMHSSQLTAEVLQPDSIAMLYTPAVEVAGIYGYAADWYGFGYFIERLSQGETAVFHGGQGHGCMTHLHLIPSTGDGIVILTNSQKSWPFISFILTDWIKWCGYPAVGMSKIVVGTKIVWSLIAILALLALWQAYRLGRDILRGSRSFAPLAPRSRLLRLCLGLVAIIVFAILGWCVSQAYLDINSIFPLASKWLGVASFIAALVLLGHALFPYVDNKQVVTKS